MSERNRKSKNFIRLLRKHYRLVIMNDDNFEIKSSIKLNPLNVLFIGSTLFVIFAIVIVFLLQINSVREVIFGEDETPQLRHELIKVHGRVDSLRLLLSLQERYLENIRNVLTGEPDTLQPRSGNRPVEYDSLAIEQHSRQDSILREEFEERRKYALIPGKGNYDFEEVEELYFFPPVSGIVTNVFEGEAFHYGVDIVSEENAPVKAVLDGKVIFSGWTLKYGNVLAIQHIDNLISIYKHNSVLLKKVGNFVEAGDVVALIGNTGEFSEGPHLHFELWHKMVPINPLDYIVFDS